MIQNLSLRIATSRSKVAKRLVLLEEPEQERVLSVTRSPESLKKMKKKEKMEASHLMESILVKLI